MTKIVALKITWALIARLVFALHNIIAVWELYAVQGSKHYLLFGLAPILLFIEAAITILLHGGDEYMWFCPSVFIFLCGSVPPIWFLELSSTVNNGTFADKVDESESEWTKIRVKILPVDKRVWLKLIEQSLLVVVLVGRWLLPKGRISRDQLSQLLLAYLAISSDIAELFNLFNEKQVRDNSKLVIVTLGVWTLSLVQFPLVLTTSKAQKARYCWAPGQATASHANKIGSKTCVQSSRTTERCNMSAFMRKLTDLSAWGILLTVFLQDGPFFFLRIYLIVCEKVSNHTMYFFIWKNSIIIMLQLYRFAVICCEKANPESKNEQSVAKYEEVGPLLHSLLYEPSNFFEKEQCDKEKTPRLNDFQEEGEDSIKHLGSGLA